MTNLLTRSTQIVQSIAFELLHDEIKNHPTKAMYGDSDYANAADLAHSMLMYSDEVHLTIMDDSTDFKSDDESREYTAAINRVGDSDAFGFGFNLALELVTKIASAPLVKHDISKIVRDSRVEYAKAVDKARCEVLMQRLIAHRDGKPSPA